MSASDDIFALGCTMMRAQADAMQMGDDNGRHARALRTLIERCHDVIDGLTDCAPCNDPAFAVMYLRAAIQEARETVDG